MDEQKALLKFGEVTKALRIERGISQETLAQALNLELSHIEAIESGSTDISSAVLFSLANFFNISLSEYFTHSN